MPTSLGRQRIISFAHLLKVVHQKTSSAKIKECNHTRGRDVYNSTASTESDGRTAAGVRSCGTSSSSAVVCVVRPSGACRTGNAIGGQRAITDEERRVSQHSPRDWGRLYLVILLLAAAAEQLRNHGGGRRRPVHRTFRVCTQQKQAEYYNQHTQQNRLLLLLHSGETHFPTKKPKINKKTKTKPNQTNKGTAASNKQSTGEIVIQIVDNSNHTQLELC